MKQRTFLVALMLGVMLQVVRGQDGPLEIEVPGTWESQLSEDFADLDGFAWYACAVEVPSAWQEKEVFLAIEHIDNAGEAFFNGHTLGKIGAFPPNYRNGLSEVREWLIPADIIRFDSPNLLSVRVYDHEGRGGFKGSSPYLFSAQKAIPLKGNWWFLPGSEAAFELRPDMPVYRSLVDRRILTRTSMVQEDGGPLAPEKALNALTVMEGFEVDLVLSEPDIIKPVFLDFDARGRLWVVEYRQYPNPAGLTRISRDKYWRSVYDKVPPPPPHHIKGKDRISIHEDTDGDGVYESHKIFLDGLNICTAVQQGRDGVWVLNPPYLLFYPDVDADDIPDADPVVHLEGFGLEDTHSVANSLCWGPDGWLYGAQGSTVTAQIIRPGMDTEPVYSQGQLIWRYHPETRRYEIFAEGGGNAFGVEIDSKGRLFSGHNGGNTRGFHYVQGGYHQKGFSKHGPLSNPYSYGYFQPMKHPAVERFTHAFVIYEGAHFPEGFQERLFGVEPLQGRVVVSEVMSLGSTFETRDLGYAIKSNDPWFRPVDIKLGPDGALYVADWYDQQVNHYRNHEGLIDDSHGRVYRLRSAEVVDPVHQERLDSLPSSRLIHKLENANRWVRHESLRVLADRRDRSVLSELKERLFSSETKNPIDFFWATYLSGGVDPVLGLRLLNHSDPHVRLWTVRVLGDRHRDFAGWEFGLMEMIEKESHIEVRSQLASTARRYEGDLGLKIFKALCQFDQDVEDPYQPLLLWWVLESHAESHRAEIISLFRNETFWERPMVREHIMERIMRRYAQAGKRTDLLTCASLFSLAPDSESISRLLAGFEEAFQGRGYSGLPTELEEQLARHAGQSLEIGIKQEKPEAMDRAIEMVRDNQQDVSRRLRYIRLLAEARMARALPVLLEILQTSSDPVIQSGVLFSLQYYDNPNIAPVVIEGMGNFPSEIRSTAINLLSRRIPWADRLLDAVGQDGQIEISEVPEDAVLKLRALADPSIRERSLKLWPLKRGSNMAEIDAELNRLQGILSDSGGSPYAGRPLYRNACGVCHKLFDEGGNIGPDLTSYQRQDLQSLLLNIVHPNAEIREGYENMMIQTKDGRLLTGFLADQDNRVIVLRGLDGENLVVPRDTILKLESAGRSLMPEGLLQAFKDEQIRDLFAYLRSTQPLNE